MSAKLVIMATEAFDASQNTCNICSKCRLSLKYFKDYIRLWQGTLDQRRLYILRVCWLKVFQWNLLYVSNLWTKQKGGRMCSLRGIRKGLRYWSKIRLQPFYPRKVPALLKISLHPWYMTPCNKAIKFICIVHLHIAVLYVPDLLIGNRQDIKNFQLVSTVSQTVVQVRGIWCYLKIVVGKLWILQCYVTEVKPHEKTLKNQCYYMIRNEQSLKWNIFNWVLLYI